MSGITPEVLWAQRSSATEAAKNHVFLTLMVADVPEKEMKLDLQPTKLTFTGTSTSKKVTYHVELEFFGEIDPKESKIHHSGRDIELVLQKKELKEAYWPRLLKEAKKVHFLKTNFDKWVDEDEQDEAPEDDEYMNKMNPMGGQDEGGFGGIDFSKLGGAGGAGGMPDMSQMMAGMGGGMGGMPDLGDMAENGEDSSEDPDDDEMPALEGEEETPAAAPAKTTEAPAKAADATPATAKITEVE